MKDINLLIDVQSEEQLDEIKADSKKNTKVIILGVLIIIVMAVTMILPAKYLDRLQDNLNTIEKEINSSKYDEVRTINSEVSSFDKALNEKRNVLKDIDSTGYPVNSIINTLKSNTPYGCYISMLDYSPTVLRVTIEVEDTAKVAEFIMNMQRLETFSLSASNSNFKINEAGEYNISFNITGTGG